MNTKVDWDAYAVCYDALLELSPYREMMGDVIKEANTESGAKILDASTGTGNFIALHSRHYSGATYCGIDNSSAMLKRARTKCANVSNCSFFQANLDTALPFADGEFDLVVSINTLYAVARPEATLQEFFRALRPGGKIVLINPTDTIENGLILKEHAGSQKPDSYWSDLHKDPMRERRLIKESIAQESVANQMILVADHNRFIATDTSFHSINKSELRELIITSNFKDVSIKLTYAKQAFFAVANKEQST